jgi:N-acetylglucosamine-6-phosphate deacetylase
LSDRTIAKVHRLRAAGVPTMITLAPEAATAARIAALAATGAVVSLGHTDATAAQTRAALAAGATCFTHLFNAMSPIQSREPGVTGAAINSTAFAGIICDGLHVADEMIALALRARPVPDRMFLVSDAMPTVGGSDHFRLYDAEIRLVNGKLVNAEGNLAGAHLTMADALHRLITTVGIPPETALKMATTIPARLIGAEIGLLNRLASDLLILDSDWRVTGTLGQVPRIVGNRNP